MKRRTVKLQKIGNSYMVTIPKEFKKQAGWFLKDKIEVEYKTGKIILKPAKKRHKKTITVEELAKHAITIKNFKEIPWEKIKEGFYDR